jgi:peptidoglycan/LPS O-acetylase OafA/YrhL
MTLITTARDGSQDQIGAIHAPVGAPATRQLIGLDLLRFAAAMLVMSFHLAFGIWAYGTFNLNYHYLGPFTWFGWVGVDIFFVLSGFIISYSAQHAGPMTFLRNRVTRLYPAAILCASITFVVLLQIHAPQSHPSLVQDWLRAVTLWPRGPYIDPSYWTLPIEIAFYILIMALLVARRFDRLDGLMGALGLISTVRSICVFLTIHQFLGFPHAIPHFPRFLEPGRNLDLYLFNYGCFFAVGGLLWLCLFRRTTTLRVLMISVFSVACVLQILGMGRNIRSNSNSSYPLAPAVILWLAATAIIILSVRGNAVIARYLGRRGAALARHLGLMTYPLYLIHQVVGVALIGILHRFIPDLFALLLTVTVLLAASFLLTRYIETPLQHWLRRILSRRRTRMSVPAATLP